MSDILVQLGITRESVVESIVSTALGMAADYKQTGEEAWENIPLSDVVDKKITAAIGNLVEGMNPFIQARIENIMDEKIREVFTSSFQQVDRWGKPTGEPTTVQDLIADEAKKYWVETVGNDGKKPDGYSMSTQTRAQWYAKQVMTDVYNKELQETVRTMAKELKAKIPQTIGEEISKAVIGYLK
jgi:hypothetical protein